MQPSAPKHLEHPTTPFCTKSTGEECIHRGTCTPLKCVLMPLLMPCSTIVAQLRALGKGLTQHTTTCTKNTHTHNTINNTTQHNTTQPLCSNVMVYGPVSSLHVAPLGHTIPCPTSLEHRHCHFDSTTGIVRKHEVRQLPKPVGTGSRM